MSASLLLCGHGLQYFKSFRDLPNLRKNLQEIHRFILRDCAFYLVLSQVFVAGASLNKYLRKIEEIKQSKYDFFCYI